MKKLLFLFFTLLSLFKVSGQTNYAQNGDFENLPTSPSCDAGAAGGNIFCLPCPGPVQTALENYWSSASPWTVPSRQTRFCFTSAASSDFLCMDGNKGPHCARMLNGEFICEPLIYNLTSGRCYYVEYFIKTPGINTGNVSTGLRFLNGRPMQCGYKRLKKGNGSAHVPAYNSVVVADTWTKIKGYYEDAIAASWISFGHQNPDKKKYANLNPIPNSFKIDDVKIVDVGPGFCPQYNYIQNNSYSDIGEIIFRSQVLTAAGFNVDSSQPTGNVNVQTTSTVTFKSATEVALLPGFTAESGSWFNAYIFPCGNECPNINADAGEDFDFCGGFSPLQLGVSPIPGQTYNWSVYSTATVPNSNALSYLSSSTIANPVFTPPSGVFAITYALTVTNACGDISYDQITITGDPSPTGTSGGVIIYNFSSSYNLVSFWLQFSSHTEHVLIQILDGNTIVGEFDLDAGVDFPAGATNVQWSNHDPWPNCKNLEVRAMVQNFCDNNTSSFVSNITWTNTPSTAFNVSPIPNIFTPDNDNINDCFAVTVNGAQEVEILIKNQYGATMHEEKCPQRHQLVNGYNCLWNGYCDAGGPGCLSNTLVNDGSYYYVLDFYGCGSCVNNNLLGSYAGYVQKLGFPGMRMTMNTPDSLSATSNNGLAVNSNNDLLKETTIYPNPANERLNVLIPSNDKKEEIKYDIYDATGKLVKQISNNFSATSIDISEFNSGIYSISIKSSSSTIKKNFVKE